MNRYDVLRILQLHLALELQGLELVDYLLHVFAGQSRAEPLDIDLEGLLCREVGISPRGDVLQRLAQRGFVCIS